MSSQPQVHYTLDLPTKGSRRRVVSAARYAPKLSGGQPIPRIARLMALAIRFEGLLRQGTLRDYAELARLGRVTRARITQIMKLLHLAPDIQETILFLPHPTNLKERNLRQLVSRVDWDQQRQMFHRLAGS